MGCHISPLPEQGGAQKPACTARILAKIRQSSWNLWGNVNNIRAGKAPARFPRASCPALMLTRDL